MISRDEKEEGGLVATLFRAFNLDFLLLIFLMGLDFFSVELKAAWGVGLEIRLQESPLLAIVYLLGAI